MFCRISEDHLSGPGSLSERLRALPAHTPPAGGWSLLRARMQQRRRRYALAGGGLALAASVLVAVALVAVQPGPQPAPGGGFVAAPRTPEVAQLISRSQSLEQRLSSARPRVVMWNSGRDASAEMLQQQLRFVDAQLNFADSESAEKLWRERVRLMNALVDLHEPDQAPALQYASYQY